MRNAPLDPWNQQFPRPDPRLVADYDNDSVFEVVRYEPEDFWQRRRDGQPGLRPEPPPCTVRLC